MTMTVNNLTNQDYWFGPLRLPANGELDVDDTSETSLYLADDVFADALNNLYILGKISVSGQASPFPRPTGTPQLMHGIGSPEGIVFAGQGSLYMRRDGGGSDSLYTKTTGITLSTGWALFNTGSGGTTYRKDTAKAVTNTVTDTDLLNGEISIPGNVLGTSNVLRLTAWGDWIQNSGGITVIPIFSLKFGGTTLLKTGAPAGSTNSGASRYGWRISAEIMNLNASNAQSASLAVDLVHNYNGNGTAAFATGEGYTIVNSGGWIAWSRGYNNGTVDTTAGCALALSVINPTATATCETKLFGALVEII